MLRLFFPLCCSGFKVCFSCFTQLRNDLLKCLFNLETFELLSSRFFACHVGTECQICTKLSAFCPSQPLWVSRGCLWFCRWMIDAPYTSVFHFCWMQTPIITPELWGNDVCVCAWVVVALCGIAESLVGFLFGIRPDV